MQSSKPAETHATLSDLLILIEQSDQPLSEEICTKIKQTMQSRYYHIITDPKCQELIIKFVYSLYKFAESEPEKDLLSRAETLEECLWKALKRIDPSLRLIKQLSIPLAVEYEREIISSRKLHLFIRILTNLFENQTPVNREMNSFFYLSGSDGITLEQHLRWPFEKHPFEQGGTFSFWFICEKAQQESRLLSILTKDRIGFEIVLRGDKIYYQRVEGESKSWIKTKPTQVYLSDMPYGRSSSVTIQFEMRKKMFLKPYFVVNLYLNEVNINNIEIDMPQFASKELSMELFKNFEGCVSSVILLSRNMAGLIEQNNIRGFMYENEIRNFTFLYENLLKHVIFLYTPIRSCRRDGIIEIYDVYGRNCALIPHGAGGMLQNLAIKKQIINYGGLTTYLSILKIIEECPETTSAILNEYLSLLINIFLNKSGAQEQAVTLNAFAVLKEFFLRTRMKLVDEKSLYLLKELYVALSNKVMRQQYLKTLIWGIDVGEFLNRQLFDMFMNLLKTFYIEDIQTSLGIFGIRDIINYILDMVELKGMCCSRHGLGGEDQTDDEHQHRLRKHFEIIQSIMLLKRSDPDLSVLVIELIQMFTLRMSPCMCEVLLDFIETAASKDSRIQEEFAVQLVPIETKLLIYSLLANIISIPVKARVLKLIFKWHGDELINKERVAAYELAACLRVTDSETFKNSVMSIEQKASLDSEDKSSQPRSTSLTQIVRNWNKNYHTDRLETMDHPAIVDILLEWTYNQKPSEELSNSGMLLLADLYSLASSNLKKHMWHQLGLRVDQTRFDADLLLWLTEALLTEVVKGQHQDKELINMILEIIVYYEAEIIVREDEANENALITSSIIQTIFTTKFSQERREAQLISYLYIIQAIFKKFGEIQLDPQNMQTLGRTIINSCYKHLTQYFMLSNFDNENSFEESSSEDIRLEQLPLKILTHLLQILKKLLNTGGRIISEQNVAINQRMMTVLWSNGFDIYSEQQQRPSLICMVFVMLQSIFDILNDLEVELKKTCIGLVEQYLLLMMELSENTGTSNNIRPYESQLSTTFMNVMSFLEIKFYQSFHYQVEGKVDFLLETKLRHNSLIIKDKLVDVFVRILKLIKEIDEIASRKHHSFYELMNPHRKCQEWRLNSFYPELLKRIDDRIIEFYRMEKISEAREKLELSLLERKISRYSSSIERVITKKMENFLTTQKKSFNPIFSGSLSKYNETEKEKYRLSNQFEEKLNLLRIDADSRQRTASTRRMHLAEKFRRQVRRSQQHLWESSRLYEGIWACSKFYSFSQNDSGIEYDNQLLDIYTRSRSAVQTRAHLKPYMKVKLRKHTNPLEESSPEQLFYIDNFTPNRPKVEDAKKTERYLKLGLQFIKKKFIDRIIRSSQENPMSEQYYFNDVLWNYKMSLWSGDVRLSRDRLQFCFKQPADCGHLALFKFKLRDDQPLMRSWRVWDIESLTFQKFLLRNNTVEISFKDGKSILFTFLNEPNRCTDFAESLARVKKILQPDFNPQFFPTKVVQPIKLFEKNDAMRKWLNGDMSNFDYLMVLNILSGRTNEDLNQYPIFPWMRAQYDSTKDSDKNYRDLSKNMGCLGNEERREKFRKVYESSEHFGPMAQQQFHYGFHYSNLPIVLQYLIRCGPYTEACKMLQGGKFDVPDRLFSSLADSFNNATRQMSDVRETTPQFYYFPEFLINSEDCKFGVQQNSHRVNHVQLPEGCSNAYEFIETHREALESEYASQNLHKWIDLIFGYKNYGKEADLSMNKYYYLTYEENADLIDLQTEDKKSVESQIAFYGKTPSQLLNKPHPQRKPKRKRPLNLQKSRRTGYFNEEIPVKQGFIYVPNKPFFNKEQSAIIHFSYSISADKYVILRRDGYGRIFSLDHNKESSGSLIDREFKIDFDKFEYTFTLDERGVFKDLPVISVNAESIILGGVWGGKLLCFDITNDKVETYSKHSDTITALTHCERSKLIASGSLNGEVIVWEYNNKMKVLYQNKMVHHYARINHISVEDELRILVSAGEDGLVVITNLFSGKLMRVLKFEESIGWAMCVSYPYTMIVILAGKKQLCYSINGQYIDEAEFDVQLKPQVYIQMGFQDRIIFKLEKEFVFLSLPDFRTESRYLPNRQGDYNLSHFIVKNNSILFSAEDKVVYVYEPEEEELG